MIWLAALGGVVLPLLALRLHPAPAIVVWLLGWQAMHLLTDRWQIAHRAAVQARPPVDYRALSAAEKTTARARADGVIADAKIVGWLPGAVLIGGGALLLLGWRHQGSGSTTSPDDSR